MKLNDIIVYYEIKSINVYSAVARREVAVDVRRSSCDIARPVI